MSKKNIFKIFHQNKKFWRQVILNITEELCTKCHIRGCKVIKDI